MNEKETIELSVDLKHREVWLFYFGYYFNFSFLLSLFIYLSIFGLILLLVFLGNNFEFVKFIQLFAITVLFSFLLIFVLIYSSVIKAETTNTKAAKHIFSNQEVKIIADNFTTQINWSYFIRAKETKSYFFLNMNDGQKIMIPKRDFTDYEQLSEFKSLLSTKLGNEVYLKKSNRNLGLK